MKRLFSTGLAIALLCAASLASAQLNAYGAAATVNGIEISNASLERTFVEYQRDKGVNVAAIRYPKRFDLMKREVLDQLIAQELVWQTAQGSAFVADDQSVDESMQKVRAQFQSDTDFQLRLRSEGYTLESYREHVRQLATSFNYLGDVSADVVVDDADIHTYYENHPEKFQIPEVVRARHILIKVVLQDSQEKKRIAREKMEDILRQLERGTDFAQLAIKYSEDSSAAQGGDLGYFPRANMVKPFADAAFMLQPGEISGIVESVYGLHVIKVEDRKEKGLVSEQEARAKIEAYLLNIKKQQAIDEEISSLRAAADIEVLIP